MKVNPISLLKLSFIIGTAADFIVALNWFLISQGFPSTSIISGFQSSGPAYEFTMFLCSLFMLGWTAILFWGYFNPIERRDLLIITSGMLLISIIFELLFFYDLLMSKGFIIGIVLRLALITKFSFSYFYSKKKIPTFEEGL
jgi:hypothetical protein